MLRLAARNLSARKFRAFSTALAVFFGVAMAAGTLLLTDSVNRSFDGLFTEVNAGIDVTVRERTVVEDPFGGGPTRGFDASILERVRDVEGVVEAEGIIGDPTITILGSDGDRIGPPQGGPPHIAVSSIAFEEFDSLTVVEGEEPASADEFTLDSDSADAEGFEVGDTVQITGPAGAKDYTLSGITEFGSGASLAGASLAEFTLEEAQRLTDKQDRFDEIDVAAAEGTSPDLLAETVAREIGKKFDVRTGAETASEDAGDLKDSFSFLPIALLVFAGIAVFVGAFLIFNTFSITIAQRVREFALLRTLGASARQVLVAVLAEAVVIGLIASALGIAGGFGFVVLVKSLTVAIGFDLPVTDLRLTVAAVLIPTAIGVAATVVSALIPALRATRVAPLEALRESGGSTEASAQKGRRRAAIAAGLVMLAVVLISLGLFTEQETEPALTLMGIGLVMLFVGIAMLGGRFVPPIASAIGWPLERLRGVTGRLARENSQREPSRTATTAAALMIGVALVVFVGVFSSSLSASITESVDRQFAGDLVVLNKDGFSPISPRIADELVEVEGVGVVSPAVDVIARIEEIDDEAFVSGLEPDAAAFVLNLDWAEGSDETLQLLESGGAIAEAGWAEDNGVETGDTLSLTGPAGDSTEVTVEGTVNDSAGLVVDSVAVSRTTAREGLGARDDAIVLLGFADGADPDATRADVEALLADRFPDTEARDQAELKADQKMSIDQIVSLIYVLLGLSIIVSIFGVVNTLALTILERTRELGMLRAIGTSRRQVRRMVRYESVINSLLGTIVGAVIGLALASAAVEALKEDGLILSIPVALPFVVLVAAIILGVVAAIRPARRASRLDVS